MTIQNAPPLNIVGGRVTSSPAGISCGISATGTALTACSYDFPLGTSVRLTATAQGTDPNYNLPYQFLGWAGDCMGESATCTLTGNADKYVLTMFAGQRSGHSNWSDPALHGPQYDAFVAGTAGALACNTCHGANLTGAGIAPSCAACHAQPSSWMYWRSPPISTGLQVAVTGASIDATNVLTVSFSLSDAQGAPVDVLGIYSTNRSMDGAMRISLSRIDFDAAGNVLPYATLTPATGSAGTITMPLVSAAAGTSGQLVENGTGLGTYTWTSPALPKIDATRLSNTHTIWIQAARQVNVANAYDANLFAAVNQEYNFIPSGGGAATRRQVVSTASCSRCHAGFKAEPNATGTGFASFHGAGRIEGPFCSVCHYPGRGTLGAAEASVFVHRIHAAEQIELPETLEFHAIAVTYPQDVRNCTECHGGALQGNQWQTRPTRAACGSCHYDVDFVTGANHGPNDANGIGVGGPRPDDSQCTLCHSAGAIATYHEPVLPKDANNKLDNNTATGNSRTNAAAIAAVGALPAGADRITYVVDTVSAVADGTGVLRPTIRFKFQRNGVDVVFNTPPTTPSASAELMNGFVGTTSAYFAWAVPQDGITAPADFNASASGNIKMIWMNSDSGTSAGDITGPDASGFYTITLTGVQIASNAVMLTGGIGYTYDLPNTQPLTQVNLAAYPTTDVSITSGTVLGVTCAAAPADCVLKSGGLIVPVQNVWRTATGYSARRAIVATDKCNACHGFLGVRPNFHVGQRNDGPTCSFCHNPNRTSSGWSANAATFIHGIHGAKNREVPFNWHAGSCPTGTTFTPVAGTSSGNCLDNVTSAVVLPSPWYPEIEYPGTSCTQCHVAGSYDFANADAAAAVPNMLWSTVGTGTYSAVISNSPYVALGTAYGSGFGYSAGTGVTTPAAGTTLVSSPLTAACASCHDSASARSHMASKGGWFYAPRAQAMAAGTNVETCLDCHGASAPDGSPKIGVVHR